MTFVYPTIVPRKRYISLSTGDKEIVPVSDSCWPMWQIFHNSLFPD